MNTITCPTFQFDTKEELCFILEKLVELNYQSIAHIRDARMYSLKQQLENIDTYNIFKYIIIEPEGVCYSMANIEDFEGDGYILKYNVVDFKNWLSLNKN